MLRAAMVRRGADDALANATRAVELEGSHGCVAGLRALAAGHRAPHDGRPGWRRRSLRRGDQGGRIVRPRTRSDTASSGTALSWPPDVGAWDAAAAFIEESDAIEPAPQVDGYLSTIPSRAARISLAIHRGDIAGARRELARATSLRPLMTAAGPAGAVTFLLAFARAHLAVDDPAGARALVAQARDVIRDRPDLGVLPAEVDTLWATLSPAVPRRGGGATSLTVAELRVLSFLPYYLSFKEIGQRLGVRETTVKSQALAIFGKLGAATRSDAVDLAVEAGLLERFLPVAAPLPSRGAAVRRDP